MKSHRAARTRPFVLLTGRVTLIEHGPTPTRTVEVGDGAAAICPSCSACVAVNGKRQMEMVRARGLTVSCPECRGRMVAKLERTMGGAP